MGNPSNNKKVKGRSGYRVARKKHRCDECGGSIKKKERYFFKRQYTSFLNEKDPNDASTWDMTLFTYDHKECAKCICERPKREYKYKQRKLRAEKRKANCPDANFKYVWSGGWCGGSNPYPDGGDVSLECHECNLHCT